MTTCALYTLHEPISPWQLEFNRQFPHLNVQDWQQITHPEQVKYGIVWAPV